MTYKPCTLCPRQCGVDRTAGELGFCRCPGTALVAKSMLHKWDLILLIIRYHTIIFPWGKAASCENPRKLV